MTYKSFVTILMLGLQFFGTDVSAQSLPGSRIAVMDLSLAASLHPNMALFDFGNFGFYKVSLGLSNQAFKDEIEKLRTARKGRDHNPQIASLESRLATLAKQRITEFQNLDSSALLKDHSSIRERLAVLNKEMETIRQQILEIKFGDRFPEITSPTETRNRLATIEREILELVREVAAERGYDIVLNKSVPSPAAFPTTYKFGPTFARGIPGLENQVYYGLLANQPPLDARESMNVRLSTWLHLTAHPASQQVFPMNPWPLVLSGGEAMTTDVIIRLYERYNIPKPVLEVVVTALNNSSQAQVASPAGHLDRETAH